MSDGLSPVPRVVARPLYARALDLARTHPMYMWCLSRLEAALWFIGTLVVFGFTLFGLEFIFAGVTAFLNRSAETADALRDSMLPLKVAGAAIGVAFAAAFLAIRRLSPQTIGVSLRNLPRQIAAAGLGLVACYSALILVSIPLVVVALRSTENVEREMKSRKEFFEMIPTENVPEIAIVLVFVAIHEEVFFRGLLNPLLRRLTGRWWIAVLISSLLFGALHFMQGPFAMIQTAALGAALSVVCILSRSLTAVIVAHFFFDFFQLLLIRALQHAHLLDMPHD